jgi:Skp family chaperone for outer membrane proteins
MSPSTLFTGLQANDPFKVFTIELMKIHKELAQSLTDMQKDVSRIKKKLRDARRNLKSKRIHGERRNFQLGGFCHVETAYIHDKLESKWKGPFKIVDEEL